jgi:hypothetical protein
MQPLGRPRHPALAGDSHEYPQVTQIHVSHLENDMILIIHFMRIRGGGKAFPATSRFFYPTHFGEPSC